MCCINLLPIHDPLFLQDSNSFLVFSLTIEGNLYSSCCASAFQLWLLCVICGSLTLLLFAQESMSRYMLWRVKWPLVSHTVGVGGGNLTLLLSLMLKILLAFIQTRSTDKSFNYILNFPGHYLISANTWQRQVIKHYVRDETKVKS